MSIRYRLFPLDVPTANRRIYTTREVQIALKKICGTVCVTRGLIREPSVPIEMVVGCADLYVSEGWLETRLHPHKKAPLGSAWEFHPGDLDPVLCSMAILNGKFVENLQIIAVGLADYHTRSPTTHHVPETLLERAMFL